MNESHPLASEVLTPFSLKGRAILIESKVKGAEKLLLAVYFASLHCPVL